MTQHALLLLNEWNKEGKIFSLLNILIVFFVVFSAWMIVRFGMVSIIYFFLVALVFGWWWLSGYVRRYDKW
jgi:positive regulator of sigma E activity